MKKLKLTQAEIDKLVVVSRTHAEPSVQGVGVVDVDFRIAIDKKAIWQYKLWASFLMRCFSEREKRKSPAYRDVTCCVEWLSFATFLEWVNREVGYKGKPSGFDLDKDILVRGNKIYSPDACSFVPRAINSLLIARGSDRGEYPVGVFYHKRDSEFRAQLSCNGRQKCLGYYSTPEEAFLAYKIAKEAHIKVVALQHKDVLKPAVFESLMNWKIEP